MSRTTTERKDTMIHFRVSEDLKKRIEAKSQGSVSEYLREVVENGSNDLLKEILNDVAKKLGMDKEELVVSISNAVNNKLLRNENGRLFFSKGAPLTPDYISLDYEIDKMKLSDGEKTQIKRNILSKLGKTSTQDDTGNGAGL